MINIEINNLVFSYKEAKQVFGSFTLNLTSENKHGHIITVMGPSGSGKSTLLKLLLQIEKPQSGSINIFPHSAVISYVPQEPVLFEHLSPEKNARYFQFAGIYKNRFDENLYLELIKTLDLKDVVEKSKSVNEISGGQKQRLSLLRALSVNPDLLFLDEPCNGLDADVKKSFLNKLREITERYGLFVLYITHHKLEAQLIADEVVYLIHNKKDFVVRNAVKASIQSFINEPPILEAATVFRFPDVKILPTVALIDNKLSVISERSKISERFDGFVLFEEHNISFNKKDGIPFNILTKSPVYSIIHHDITDIELMISSAQLNGYNVGERVFLKLNGPVLTYNSEGLLKSIDEIHNIILTENK